MNYLTTIQASKKWNISSRRITILANKGRIPNAIKFGRIWLIPDNATKPIDARYKISKIKNNDELFFRYPSFEGRDINSFNPPLSKIELKIKKLSEAFIAFKLNEAEEILNDCLKEKTDIYHTICIIRIACYIYAFLNKIDLFYEYYQKLLIELKKDFPHKKEMSLYIHEIDASIFGSKFFYTEFNYDYSYSYHESFLPHLATLLFVKKSI